MSKVTYSFVPTPRELGTEWLSVSFYQRAVAGEIFRVLGPTPARILGADWQEAVCRALAIHGRERREVKRAMDALVAAGLMSHDGEYLYLAWASAKRKPTATQPQPNRQSTATQPSPKNEPSIENRSNPTPLDIDKKREEESLRSLARARAPEGQPFESREQGFAARVAIAFQRLHLAAFHAQPAMGGSNVAEFPGRLLATARARGVDPIALLELVFGAWQRRLERDPLTANEKSIIRRAPYAAFVNEFGDLLPPVYAAKAVSGDSVRV